MLAIISLIVAAVIFLLLGITDVLTDTDSVRWVSIGWFFVVLGLILAILPGDLPARWRKG